jgi:hypothetical protein
MDDVASPAYRKSVSTMLSTLSTTAGAFMGVLAESHAEWPPSTPARLLQRAASLFVCCTCEAVLLCRSDAESVADAAGARGDAASGSVGSGDGGGAPTALKRLVWLGYLARWLFRRELLFQAVWADTVRSLVRVCCSTQHARCTSCADSILRAFYDCVHETPRREGVALSPDRSRDTGV